MDEKKISFGITYDDKGFQLECTFTNSVDFWCSFLLDAEIIRLEESWGCDPRGHTCISVNFFNPNAEKFRVRLLPPWILHDIDVNLCKILGYEAFQMKLGEGSASNIIINNDMHKYWNSLMNKMEPYISGYNGGVGKQILDQVRGIWNLLKV